MKPRTVCTCLAVAAALFVTPHGSAQAPAPKDVAVDAAKWIRTTRVGTPFGIAWPADPRTPRSVNTTLYSGSPGVVLFLIELYATTGDATYLDEAKRGADDLATKVGSEAEAGFYDGVAGLGFTLGETWRASRDEKYHRAALAAVRALEERARPVGKGVQWNSSTDIISGTAGIGLFLLYADQTLHAPNALALALRAGDRLIDLGEPARGGARWASDLSSPRQLPNFANGTAGIAYFLATLFKTTREPRFLDGAYAGARYLRAIAKTDGDVCLVPYDQGSDDLYYLGWSQGPAGTARLFYQLYTITSDKTWMTWVDMSANGILKSGIPEQRTPGFWNVGQADGSAGVAQFFLDLYGVTKDQRHLNFAIKLSADLIAHVARDSAGSRWAQAEKRTDLDTRVAQTGYMQGAAGIGISLLHFDAVSHGLEPFVHFPDSPWP
jgi:lantibiotic modifying enzyme